MSPVFDFVEHARPAKMIQASRFNQEQERKSKLHENVDICTNRQITPRVLYDLSVIKRPCQRIFEDPRFLRRALEAAASCVYRFGGGSCQAQTCRIDNINPFASIDLMHSSLAIASATLDNTTSVWRSITLCGENGRLIMYTLRRAKRVRAEVVHVLVAINFR